jgi:signal transduction histidine kinase
MGPPLIGGSFWVGCCTGLVLCLSAGALLGVVAYRRFVLLERRAREAERLAELGTLTGGLAHEIKNPLSTVQLNLQLLSEELDPRDKNQQRMVHRLGVVQRETGRLREILDDFLRYAGKMELDRKPTDLNDLLEELVDFFAPQAQLQRVQIRLRRDDLPLMAFVDPKFIKQAVLNLMINATQAMPDGGELILSASGTEGMARIDVIDTGQGVSAEAMDNIFKAYYSTKRGGTGLGLAISQRIAREHGGILKVESEAGKGSDFSLTVPIAP